MVNFYGPKVTLDIGCKHGLQRQAVWHTASYVTSVTFFISWTSENGNHANLKSYMNI